MRRLVAVAAAALAALPLTASAGWFSSGPTGSGHKVTEQRSPGEFQAVRLKGSLDVKVVVGPATSVAVTIDDNLQPLVITRLEGDALVVESKGMSYRGDGLVTITTPTLRALGVEGSGDASLEGGRGDLELSLVGSGDIAWRGEAGTLTVSVAGSGDVKLEGRADRARLEVDGSGDIHGRGLQARSAEVAVAGSGDIAVTLAGGTLKAEVHGSGDVTWYGTAQVERSVARGSGDITHR